MNAVKILADSGGVGAWPLAGKDVIVRLAHQLLRADGWMGIQNERLSWVLKQCS
jgi:hypothetical protein